MKAGLTTAALTLLLAVAAGAQTQAPLAFDPSAKAGGTNTKISGVFTATTPAGMAYKDSKKAAFKGPPTVPFPGGGNRYPGDLTYQGGKYITQAQSHAIYLVNSPNQGGAGCTPYTIAACWGNPEGFLTNLGVSDFIHVVDQYTARTDSNRYTVGPDAYVYFVSGVTPHLLTDATMQAIVHLAASAFGWQTGYDGVFHVFLPPGTDECFDSTFSTCYSPDIPSSFAFCGYHSSVDFPDALGHTIYTVEPFENVGGCSVPQGGPQGQLADSTNNVLSHEMFETITDPDGDAWWNAADNGLFFQEIGDECAFVVFPTTGGEFFNPSVFRMNGVKYAAQPEYSNIGHACRTNVNNN